MLRISDDPAAAGRALGLYRGIDLGKQLVRNAQATNSFYEAADDALARVDSALIEARGVAVHAAQTVLSEDERVALAYTLEQTIGSVFAAGNTIYREHQLLGGFLDSGNAFRYDGKEIVYSGNNAIGRTELGAGSPSDINATGNDALGTNAIFLKGDRLGAAMDDESRLVDLRQGEGSDARSHSAVRWGQLVGPGSSLGRHDRRRGRDTFVGQAGGTPAAGIFDQ